MPKISVHIVTYNSADTIAACVESLLAQRDIEFELVAIDNGSQDDTVSRLVALGVNTIVNSDNVGYSVAHNQALARTNSEYVLTLNPDVVLDRDFLKYTVATLDVDEKIGAVSGYLQRIEQIGQAPTVIDSTGLYMRRNRRQGLRCEGQDLMAVDSLPRQIFGPDGAAAVYRRAMLDDIAIQGEVFDEDFFMHKEDVDICWRAQLQGWHCVFVPQAIAYHIRSFRPGKRDAVSPAMRFYGVRNRYLLMLKNEVFSSFMRDIIPIAFYDIAILIYLCVRERHSLSALKSFWTLRKKILIKRRVIQARRTLSQDDVFLLFTQPSCNES